MTGKAYTMKEMKAIVNYLVEHKAFSEIRGRKMWMDFASSKDTTRTWQSLKETFLKRILPDIHNPYYKLSLIEIASFKQGLDIVSKLDNKLDFEPVNDEPKPGTSKENGHNDEQAEDGDKEQQNKDNVDEQPGEDVKISENLNNIRDSTETLVLEPCYHTAEDIRKDLENDNVQNKPDTTKGDERQNDDQKQNDVQQDGTSDGENIDEINNAVKDTTDQQTKKADVLILISDSEEKQLVSKNIANETGTKEQDEIKNNNDSNPKNTSSSILNPSNADQSKPNENKENHDKTKNITQNSSNTTVDTQLPNNPEELKQSKKAETSKSMKKLSIDRKRNNRATSEDVTTKRKKIKQKTVSDTEALKNCKHDEKEMEVTNQTQQEKSDAINVLMDKETNSENLKEIPENQIEGKVTSNEVEPNVDSNCGQIQVTPEIENPCLKSVNLYEEQFSCTIYSHSDEEQREKKIEPQKTKEKVIHSRTDVPKSNLRIVEKNVRENALARAFGFSSNGTRNRKRSISYNKRRSSSHKKMEISSDSSSSSYESESNFVSPPRGNNKRRKYWKPESHRILSLGEEGTLFVMNGKKIYPVIKNGRALKNFVTYSSDGQSDNEESYWKLKYVEERKKATELAKQLENFTKSIGKESSVLPVSKTTDLEVPEEIAKPQGFDVPCTKSTPVSKMDEKSIKIKITNNEKEVQVEGPWSCINPVLEQVVQMIKDTENIPINKPAPSRSSSDLIALSGISTPAETSAKRVAEMEQDIFKEIEEIDKAERENPEMQKESENTKTLTRKSTRKKNVSANKIETSPKKAKVDETKTDQLKVPRRTRTPRKLNDTNADISDAANTTNKRNSKRSETEEQEEDILYKFPSPPREINRAKRAPPRPRYTLKTARIYSSPDHLSIHSEDTQGYIDTDCSPVICLRKKRKTSITSRKCSRIRKKSIPSITEDLSSESSLLTAPVRSQTFVNSSLSSQIYRSDSYQLLMPKAKNAPNYLEKIEEFSMNSNEDELHSKNSFEAEDYFDNPNNLNDKDQSCDLTLPTSPVLSIVENISIDKSLRSTLDENDVDEPITLNNLMPAVADVSMPLMESTYEVRKKSEDGTQYHYNLEDQCMSECVVNEVSPVQNDVPNSISTKLKNLVIESAKKDTAKLKLVEFLEEPLIEKKAKAKKRSSTPRKRQTRKLKSPLSDPCIEEHTESCSRAVNRSRTPIIKITTVDSEHPPTKKATKGREKIKKDIIKVKLPKVVSRRKSDIACKTDNDVGISNDTESGIFLHGLNDSVELIHNHSDTCCKAHECINQSLEIIEPSPQSIITIESDSCRVDEYIMNKNVALEMINQNAHDGMEVIAALAAKSRSCSEISNSLLTDDLSDDITTPRSSKWYLLSEEENSTQQEKHSQSDGYGANLNQIFPITCAVPNLSTITEASKDIDENSRNDVKKLFNF